MQDIFNLFNQQLIGEEKAEAILEISGLHLHISLEGLKEIGISDLQIEKTNAIIEETINSLLDDPNVKERFQKLCANEGFAIGHSLLIIYIAGRIAHDIHLNYEATMKKICVAAFYHDFSIFDLDALEEQLKIEDIHDEKIKMQILEHPTHSVNFLPTDLDFIEDTRKIILEHHEQPNGDGYPKKLTAKQIAPLSCLFILSQEITFCLIRNNFSRERLSDYLINKENYFNDGNFAKFYNAARAVFVLNT